MRTIAAALVALLVTLSAAPLVASDGSMDPCASVARGCRTTLAIRGCCCTHSAPHSPTTAPGETRAQTAPASWSIALPMSATVTATDESPRPAVVRLDATRLPRHDLPTLFSTLLI